jgi:exosortase/archaeosortase family protein
MRIKNEFFDLILRYFILVIVAVPSLWLFYLIFTPLTAYPVLWILGIFYQVSFISGRIILIKNFLPIELISSCIAGSAYYLLLILNLSTREIALKKRLKLLLLAFVIFLVLNIIRITFLSFMAVSGSNFFFITHVIFWYSLSTIFVVAIWFYEVWKFKVKGIPFYSDIKFLYKKARAR